MCGRKEFLRVQVTQVIVINGEVTVQGASETRKRSLVIGEHYKGSYIERFETTAYLKPFCLQLIEHWTFVHVG